MKSGKLWGFHLQKPHNLNFGIMGLLQMKSKIMGFLRKNWRFSGNFANEKRKLWGFAGNYGVFCK